MKELDTTFIRERWAPALLSGEYEQGTGYLRHEQAGKVKWCCLGVCADLLKDEFNASWSNEGRHHGQVGQILHSTQVLPAEMAKRVGISQHGRFWLGGIGAFNYGVIGDEVRDEELTEINDAGSEFPEIAAGLLRLCDFYDAEKAKATQ